VDPARLHQALLNLLDNALRYSPSDSTIEVNLELRDRWCLIGVRDHGPGLSASDQKRMFQRFYRGDPSRARAPRVGSGLGLAIVQQIALSQGGLVRASNHSEGGALLELLLPRA
jgi:two-component system phosphate regulon sensor histidine kinase PhoR